MDEQLPTSFVAFTKAFSRTRIFVPLDSIAYVQCESDEDTDLVLVNDTVLAVEETISEVLRRIAVTEDALCAEHCSAGEQHDGPQDVSIPGFGTAIQHGHSA